MFLSDMPLVLCSVYLCVSLAVHFSNTSSQNKCVTPVNEQKV